jgi:DNA-directed RNA polymerase specialized sigma subunit
MFATVGDVVAALKTFGDFYAPRTNSVLVASGKPIDTDADPFRRGFIDSLEIRTELLKRLGALDERERAAVMLWYVSETPVRDLCARLGVSRATLYRLRDRALGNMIDAEASRTQATA